MNVLQFFLLSIPDHTLIPVLLLVLKMDDVPAVLIRSDDGVWIQTEIKKKESWHQARYFVCSEEKMLLHMAVYRRQIKWRKRNKEVSLVIFLKTSIMNKWI